MGVMVEEKDLTGGDGSHPIDVRGWAKVEERSLACTKCGRSDVLLVGSQHGDQVCSGGCEE